MGLFSDNHYHRHNHDNSTHIKYPDTIKEIKAPTDESIRILNEMQEKAIQNVVSKIEVKDNFVDGQIWIMDMLQTTAKASFRIICKFKINGQEFVVEKDIDRYELNEIATIEMNGRILEYGKSVMLWFALKQFAVIAHKQILGIEPPDYALVSFMNKK